MATEQLRMVETGWQRWEARISIWFPYITLLIAAGLSVLEPLPVWPERALTAALVGLTAAFVYGMHTRAPAPRNAQVWRMRGYFGGLLLLSTVLMRHQPVFFIFAITGFFHAALLRPWPLMVLGVAATSALLNMLNTGFPWPDVGSWIVFGSIMVIQIPAISFGILMGEKLSALSEQRRQALVQLQATLAENAALQAQLVTQARASGVQDERQRMAHEIHDTLAQGLTGIITQLEAAERTDADAPQRQHHLAAARTLARASLVEARRAVHALQPAPLDTVPLPEALAQLCREWSEQHAVVDQGPRLALSAAEETTDHGPRPTDHGPRLALSAAEETTDHGPRTTDHGPKLALSAAEGTTNGRERIGELHSLELNAPSKTDVGVQAVDVQLHKVDPEQAGCAPLSCGGGRGAGGEGLLCQRHDVAIQFETTGVPEPLLPEIEATLFRVAQEALTNVAKHAGARRVGVTLSYMPDIVILDIRDDGVGIGPSNGAVQAAGHGVGIRGMEQRLKRVAGSLTVESAPGHGTALSASVPALSRAESGQPA